MLLSESALSIVWKFFLLVLPISSFPVISRLLGGASVAPLAVVPLLLILIFWWLPAFVKNGFKLPYQVKPLLIYFMFGLLTTLLVVFRNVPTFQETKISTGVLEVIITFGMGVGFYIATVFVVKDEERLRSTLFWLSISGIIMMAYSWTQVGVWYGLGQYPQWFYKLQSLISANGSLFPRRATGFAFEPSWLAHELNMIFIPIWLGLYIKRQSVFKTKFFNKIQVELVLLVIAVATLFISFSRIGWITFFVISAYLVFRFANDRIKQLSTKNPEKHRGFWFRFRVWSGLVAGLISVLLLAGILLSRLDPRMRDLFMFERLFDDGFMRWASKLVFLERVMYWIASYRVFQIFPILGAGFGIPGFFFQSTVPVYGSQLLDINDFMLKPFFLPNAKNLWVRILSETGIIGFALFTSWVVNHWRNAVELEKISKNELLKTMGLIGKLVLISLLVEGFSLDSFGLPYIWVGVGLITASWFIDQNLRSQPGHSEQTSTRSG